MAIRYEASMEESASGGLFTSSEIFMVDHIGQGVVLMMKETCEREHNSTILEKTFHVSTSCM